MRMLLSFVVLVFLLLTFTQTPSELKVGIALKDIELASLDKDIAISYRIHTGHENKFAQIMDLLNAGKTIHIAHNVKILNTDTMHSQIASTQVNKILKLDVLNKAFYYGDDIDNLKRTYNKPFVRDYIFSILEETLTTKTTLEVGKEYLIDVSFYAESLEGGSLLIQYIPKSWLQDVLNVREQYIAK